MGKRKIWDLLGLLIASFVIAKAQDNFENAEQASDFLSSGSSENFDLRHTIPGEPGIDYPIYHEVPETSFICTDRHEGYYADMESRCQAFHICTYTARSIHGFSFLCPNGTLFSQKNFVCDWYRNVNCDESEMYYGKNMASHVGNSKDMMETVRQMIEYPIKTISKAFQNGAGIVKRPMQQAEKTLSNELANEAANFKSSNKVPPKSYKKAEKKEAEPTYSYEKVKNGPSPALKHDNHYQVLNKPGNVPLIKQEVDENSLNSLLGTQENEDIYVNSLGELSTDPGIQFNRTNAHIIAEYPRKKTPEKHNNFAAKINAGLNDIVEVPPLEVIAPDYIKRIRMTKEEALQHDLISNINDLLEEVAIDLDPKESGYQTPNPTKAKHNFRFLSRGFETFADKKGPYVYKKPQQTPSTVHFMSNTLSQNTQDTQLDTDNEDSKFGLKFQAEPNDDIQNIKTSEILLNADNLNLLALNENNLQAEMPSFEALTLTTTEETPRQTTPEPESLEDKETFSTQSEEEEIDEKALEELEDKSSVNKQAASLLLAGVQLSTLDAHDENKIIVEDFSPRPSPEAPTAYSSITLVKDTLIDNNLEAPLVSELSSSAKEKNVGDLILEVVQDVAKLPTQVTTSAPSSTQLISASPETVTETNKALERLKGFRRFSQLQRPSGKPFIVGKKENFRKIPRRTTTTSTTPKPTPTTTLSYLKRIAASRLRLQKLTGRKESINLKTSTESSTTRVTTPTLLDLDPEEGPEKSHAIRNINTETSQSVQEVTRSRAKATWESVQGSLKRFQVKHRDKSTASVIDNEATSPTESSPTVSTLPTSTTRRYSSSRGQVRYSNFKNQKRKSEIKSSTITTLRPRPTRPRPTRATTTRYPLRATNNPTFQTKLNNDLNKDKPVHTHSPFDSYTQTTHLHLQSILNSLTSPLVVSTTPLPEFNKPASNAVSSTLTSSATSPEALLSLEKLRRSIVDDSNLQNFENQAASRHRQQNSHNNNNGNGYSKYDGQTKYEKGPRDGNHQDRNHQLPQIQIPGIVIAKAEGKRIEPNAVDRALSSLVTETPTTTQKVTYVPLNDFLSHEFGSSRVTSVKTTPSTLTAADQQKSFKASPQHFPPKQQQRSDSNNNYQGTKSFNQQNGLQQVKPQQSNHLSNNQAPFQYSKQSNFNNIGQRGPNSFPQIQQALQISLPQQHQQQRLPVQQQNNIFGVRINQGNTNQQQQQQSPVFQQHYSQAPQQLPLHTQQQQFLPQRIVSQFSIQQTPRFETFQPQGVPNQQLRPQFTQQSAPQQQLNRPVNPQPGVGFNAQNIFANFQQHQSQLPQFPPLNNVPPTTQLTPQASTTGRSFSNTFNNANGQYLNVQLPGIAAGLIPAPTTSNAQKRIDASVDQLQLTAPDKKRTHFLGASSYDVPLSSIGRLPNDIPASLRRRLRRY